MPHSLRDASAWSGIWEVIRKNKDLQSHIPIFHNALGSCPYTVPRSTALPAGLSWSAPAIGAGVALKTNKKPCRICGQLDVKDVDRQKHVGIHILKSRLRVQDDSAKVEMSRSYPCGFCGIMSCPVAIKGGSVDSACPHTYGFRTKEGGEYREKRPCTNVPVKCPLCGETHWKYNFPQHFTDRHPSWASQPEIDATFESKIRVEVAEQLSLGIPEEMVILWPPQRAGATPSATVGASHVPPTSPSHGDKENVPPSRD